MKKRNRVLALGLVLTLLLASNVFANGLTKIDVRFNDIKLYVDGKKVDTDNILYNKTTYVPLRATADMLKKNVRFDENTKTVNISDSGEKDTSAPVKGTGFNGKKSIDVRFNDINIVVNGNKISEDNILYKGTTYVPIRAVAESMGKKVAWDGKNFTANIGDTEEIIKVEKEEKVKKENDKPASGSDITTEKAFKDAIASGVRGIEIKKPITVNGDIVINSDTAINGKGLVINGKLIVKADLNINELTVNAGKTDFSTDKNQYAIELHNAKVSINDVTVKNADGAIFINGSDITVNNFVGENIGYRGIFIKEGNKDHDPRIIANTINIKPASGKSVPTAIVDGTSDEERAGEIFFNAIEGKYSVETKANQVWYR